jgi:hypothetical protein
VLAVLAALACQLAEPGSIDVDGMLDDWEGVKPVRANGKDKDQSFDLRCLTDGTRLAIAIDVRDDELIRFAQATAKKQAGEDRVTIALGTGAPLQLALFPGTEKIAPRRLLGGKKAPKWITVEDTQQPKGWSIELELPLAKIGGWSASAPSVDAAIAFHDADDFSAKGAEALEQTITLSLGDKPKLLDGFLREARLKKQDVVIDQVADVDRQHPGTERVVAGGKVLGVLTDTYGFVELPVSSAKDVLKIELVDLRGDGGRVVVTHLRQRGNGGSRDLIAVWGADGGRVEQLFAVEVRKEADGNRLESRWELVAAGKRSKRGKKKAKGKELVVIAQPATGWDEDTFEEEPAEDAEPIHLPWDPARSGGVFWLDGDTVRSQPIPARK